MTAGLHNRTHRCVSWLVWHSIELAALAVTLVLAVASPWFLLATLAIVVGWSAHETRMRLVNRAILTGRDRPAPAGDGSDDLASA
jgi:hypothetical protein